MKEFLYGYNSVLIAAVLFAMILIANEAGHRVGIRWSTKNDEGAKSQTAAIQAAILGLLALLLGFTFTMALQRFDSRSAAVIDEANAVGTALLRTQLLDPQVQDQASRLIHEYVELRLQASEVDLTQREGRRQSRADAHRLQDQLWAVALQASEIDPRPITSGMFIQSLNEMIDAYGRRDAALKKHVPEVVLLLLFAVFVIGGALLGYSAGLAGARPLVATIAMSFLIVLVIFIIIDLDRPRRGLIRVNHDSLLDLSDAPP